MAALGLGSCSLIHVLLSSVLTIRKLMLKKCRAVVLINIFCVKLTLDSHLAICAHFLSFISAGSGVTPALLCCHSVVSGMSCWQRGLLAQKSRSVNPALHWSNCSLWEIYASHHLYHFVNIRCIFGQYILDINNSFLIVFQLCTFFFTFSSLLCKSLLWIRFQ